MSRTMKELVFGVDRFGPERVGYKRRLVMLALADRVSDEDGDSCFPGLQDIADRTELGLSSTKQILAQLLDRGRLEREYGAPQVGPWLTKTTRPGYGTVYTLNVSMLQAHQRPPREQVRASRLSRPVTSQPVTGQLPLDGPSEALRWPVRPSHIRKNPSNPSVPQSGLGDGALKPKKTAKPKRETHPLYGAVKQMVEQAALRVGHPEQWGPGTSGALAQLLKRCPTQPESFWAQCVTCWERSDRKYRSWGLAAVVAKLAEFSLGWKDEHAKVHPITSTTAKPRNAAEKAKAA